MTKEILLGIQDPFSRLFLTIPAHFLSWLVYFKLGFQLTGDKVKLRKMIPGVLVSGIYSLYARQYLPELIYGLLIMVLFAILLKVIGRMMILRAIGASGFVYLLVLFGIAVLKKPLLAGCNHTAFLVQIASGATTGTLIETVFPALALIIFSTFNISLIPSLKGRVTQLDFSDNLLFGILFFSIYNLTVMFLLSAKNIPSYTLMKIVIIELVLIAAGMLVFFMNRSLLKRQCEQEKLRFEQEKVSLQMEHSHRLIETISSERREFRNRLQVMNMFAAMGKNEELSNYIQSVAAQMSETKMLDIENPIIVAAIVSRKVLGREKGVETVVYSNTSLNDFTIDLIKLGETLNLILGLFIENEVLSRSIMKRIFMDVEDDGDNYNFQFDNSEEAATNFRTGKYRNYKLPCTLECRKESLDQFKIADGLIKDLEGQSSYIVKGGYVVQLSFKLKKKPGTRPFNSYT
jgi:hypothetical protein